MSEEARTFPLMWDRKDTPVVSAIPWSLAEKAYAAYSARYGRSQSLGGLAERGGFHYSEMDLLLPTWRQDVDEIAMLRTRAQAAEAELAAIRAYLGVPEGQLATDWIRGLEEKAFALPDEVVLSDGETR